MSLYLTSWIYIIIGGELQCLCIATTIRSHALIAHVWTCPISLSHLLTLYHHRRWVAMLVYRYHSRRHALTMLLFCQNSFYHFLICLVCSYNLTSSSLSYLYFVSWSCNIFNWFCLLDKAVQEIIGCVW